MVLSTLHREAGMGHFSVGKTLKWLQQKFCWPGCCVGMELYVHWKWVAMDILGPFPITDTGNQYLLMACSVPGVRGITQRRC